MNDFSVIIGGKAGDGVDSAGSTIARILNQLGYRLYIYRDYPSIIRGGHTFSIIRASENKIAAYSNKADLLLALNQDSVNFHSNKLKESSLIIYDSDTIDPNSIPSGKQVLGLPLTKIIKEENAPAVMRNSCIIGALCKVLDIKWDILEQTFRKSISKKIDLNLKVARRGYNEAKAWIKLEILSQPKLPILTGNEAIGLGLIKGGLRTYIAYPMTPSSSLLHFLANIAEDFSLDVIHPESEIAVILMALGFSYMGERVAVGTSGGGFCLMNEGFSFAGMAELPLVVMVGQRPGPSTGLPTYTSQTELHFVLNAGQGEFPRFVVAPGDAEEAFFWSTAALNMSWKYQMPSVILSDTTLCEGTSSFDLGSMEESREEEPVLWDRKGTYERYKNTKTGISPLTFAPDKEAIVKVDSYEHDEYGITTEDPQTTKMMQDKRLRKIGFLSKDLDSYEAVKIHGNKTSSVAILCWGSNKGVCVEVAERLDLKVIQPIVLSPLPIRQFQKAVQGVKKLICVENNATAQLVRLINQHGFSVDGKILKYDGRSFAVDELEEAVIPYLMKDGG